MTHPANSQHNRITTWRLPMITRNQILGAVLFGAIVVSGAGLAMATPTTAPDRTIEGVQATFLKGFSDGLSPSAWACSANPGQADLSLQASFQWDGSWEPIQADWTKFAWA